MRNKIIFRVDGGNKIGLGHISRCCMMADILKNNFDIFFFTRADSAEIINTIKQYCIDVFILDNAVSYRDEATAWVNDLTGNEIIVLDGYNFDTYYQEQLKKKGNKIICIDDIHAYHFVSDIIINHAPGIDKSKYSREPYTQLYVGTEYALLKKIFLQEAVKTHKHLDIKKSPVLICFGGADPQNVTKNILEEILKLMPGKKVNIIVGAAYQYFKELKKVVEANSSVFLYVNIPSEEMLALMQQSHIAITSASTIALEYICVKGNLFLKCIADNQKEIFQSLINKKCAYDYETLKYAFADETIINNQYLLIDGKSSDRILNIFNELS